MLQQKRTKTKILLSIKERIYLIIYEACSECLNKEFPILLALPKLSFASTRTLPRVQGDCCHKS